LGLKFEVSHQIDEIEWNQKLQDNKASTTYQIPNWAKVYRSFKSKPIFITVRNGSGEIEGQLLALIHNDIIWDESNFFVKTIGTKLNLRKTLTWFYGPIIHDDENFDQITLLILQALDFVSNKYKITMIKGSFHPFLKQPSTKLLIKNGYDIQPWATFITDLKKSKDEFYESLGKKTRYDIRKSEKNELEFVVSKNRSDFSDLIKLKTLENKVGGKIRNHPLFYDDHWKYLHKYGYEKLFLAKSKGQTIAAILNIVFNGNVIQHGVAVSSRKELLGGPFLTWNAINWCINMNQSTYDMGGINPNPKNEKEKSMNFYKSKWGGNKVDYLRITKILNPFKQKFSAVLTNPQKLFMYKKLKSSQSI